MTKSISGDKAPAGSRPKTVVPPGKEEEQGLRDYYELGVVADKSCFGKDRKGATEAVRSLAARENNPEFIVRQARTLVTRYSPEEFEELCRLRTPDKKSLTVSHARSLMTVEDKAVRAALQERAAKEGWNVDRLKKEVKKKKENKKNKKNSEGKVGPPMREINTLADLIWEIETQTRAWLVHHERSWGKGEPELFREVQVSTEDERKELRISLNELRQLLSQLGENARNLKDHVQKIRIGMKRPDGATTPKSAPGTAAGNSKDRSTR